MKKIETIHAVGHVLCHDVTQIIKDKTKGPVFRKGHIVTEEDIPVLLSVGKDHLYVWEKNENMLHENEAAEILFDLCRSEGMKGSEIKEGKIEVIADRDGLLKDRPKEALCGELPERDDDREPPRRFPGEKRGQDRGHPNHSAGD